MHWSDLTQDKETVEDFCEHGNDPSGTAKSLKIFEWLHNWRLLKNDSSPWN
jgi:hypothetical protein